MITSNYRNAMNWMPGFVSEFLNNELPATRESHFSPAMNVMEDAKSYKLELAVPGTKKEDFSIHLTESGNLKVVLEKKQNSETKSAAPETEEKSEKSGVYTTAQNGMRYLRREFAYTKFQQIFTVPEDVQCDHISANVADGILTILLPKKEQPIPTTRQIDIF